MPSELQILYQNSQTLTHAAGVLPGHPLQKRREVQWDIGAALGADAGADESTSPQAGITTSFNAAMAASFNGRYGISDGDCGVSST
jgi:hypothetical protein